MSGLTISRATEAEDAAGNGCENRRTWTLGCTDAFGRRYELTITGFRCPATGIGFKAPTGEFAFVDVDHAAELAWVLAEARAFARGGGRCCTPKC